MKKKTLSHLSARFKTARVVLWISLVFFGAAVLLYGFLLIRLLLNSPDRPIEWTNLVTLLGLVASTVIALRLIKKSLAAGMYLYVGGATLCVLGMVLSSYFIYNYHTLPFVVYGFHLGILVLGLILGFKSGIIYTFLVGAIFVGLGFLYQARGNAVSAIVIAFGMATPSLIVDLLEKELRRTEAKFSTLFQESLDVALVVDEADGQILNANRATRATLGYESRDLVAQPVARLFPPDAPLKAEELLRALRTQDAIFGSQMFLRADGALCPMDLTATRVPWEAGLAVLLTLRDVTERQRAEDELRQHREHLEDLVRARTAELEASNEELEAFAHTVAHDLRNPAATLIGLGDLLTGQTEGLTPDQRSNFLQAIGQTGRKMINIINELLLLASVRKEQIQYHAINMSAVVQGALQRCATLNAETGADIRTPETWPSAWGYAPWIEEVWFNYLSNALKYGGRPAEAIPPCLELGYDMLDCGLPILESTIQNPQIVVNAANPAKIRFWVRDNGKGLTPEEQARLFIPFTRLDQAQTKGYGLGLSIARRIVEKCGGEVGVESVVGQGSTFYFTLPTLHTPDEQQP